MKISPASAYLISYSKQSQVICNLQPNMTTKKKKKKNVMSCQISITEKKTITFNIWKFLDTH